jgi:archaellum biogenesis ATPase FlaH
MAVRLDITKLAEVQEKDVSWLWEPYIAVGKLTVLEGDPESGKTFLALEVAAAVTKGRVLPAFGSLEQKPVDPASVLFLTGEDDLADTIAPRFRRALGDAARFFVIKGVVRSVNGKDTELGITLSDVALLDEAMKTYRPALMIVDPFQAFLGGKVDFHRANEVRPILDGLRKLAEKYGCAIILIRHLSKAAQNKVAYQGMGSVDITAAARTVLRAGINPIQSDVFQSLGIDGKNGALHPQPDESRYALVSTKCNVAQRGPSIGYNIKEGKLIISGVVDVTEADLQSKGLPIRRPRMTATEFLMQQLQAGPRLATELFETAAKHNISETTLERASRSLGIVKRPGGFGQPWYWSLPGAQPNIEPEGGLPQEGSIKQVTDSGKSVTN